MDATYLNRLPAELRERIESLERYSNSNVEVEVRNDRTGMGCDIDYNGAKILVPAGDYFPTAAVFHELRHIERIYLERVPRLVYCDHCEEHDPAIVLGLQSAFRRLDNNLEHLVIVPQELERWPERTEHWETRVSMRLAESAERSTEAQKSAVVELWPFACHVLPRTAVTANLGEQAKALGVFGKGEALYADVIPHLESKKATTAAWMKHFPGYQNCLCLEYIDIQDHRHYEERV